RVKYIKPLAHARGSVQNKNGEVFTSPSEKLLRCLILRSRFDFGQHIDAAAAFIECDFAIGQSEQRPIATGADVLARDEFRTALANDDAAGGHMLAAKFFYTEPFADAVTAVTNTALSFFMCHKF